MKKNPFNFLDEFAYSLFQAAPFEAKMKMLIDAANGYLEHHDHDCPVKGMERASVLKLCQFILFAEAHPGMKLEEIINKIYDNYEQTIHEAASAVNEAKDIINPKQ